MNHRRVGLRRRLIALFLVLGFGFFSAESLIADVCDGDSGLSGATVTVSGDPSGPERPAPAPGHTIHVCHCVHAHGGMPALVNREAALPATPSVVLRLIQSTPPSPSLELQLRPPIA